MHTYYVQHERSMLLHFIYPPFFYLRISEFMWKYETITIFTVMMNFTSMNKMIIIIITIQCDGNFILSFSSVLTCNIFLLRIECIVNKSIHRNLCDLINGNAKKSKWSKMRKKKLQFNV